MQDDKTSEQIFDSLVEELVTGQGPPDLTARILTAWQREQNAAINGIPGVGSQASVVQRSSATPRVIVWLTAIAACLLLGFVGWKWGLTALIQQPSVAQQDKIVSPSPSKNMIAGSSKQFTEKQPTSSANPETIAAPFDLDSEIASLPAANSIQPTKDSIGQFPAEVVAEIDRRMSELWTSVEVVPSSVSPPTELAQRISQTLTGQDLSDNQLAQLVDSAKQQLDKSTLITNAVDSIAFKRWWSQKLVQLWLGRSGQSEAESALIEALASRMSDQKRWNLVVAELIGGEISEDSLANKFLGMLAGGENHRLVDCIGNNFMNQQVACMRCHRQPDSENLPGNQQSTYWSLIALVKGVEAKGPGQLVTDRQLELFAANARKPVPSVYFELPNGALQQAFARLPNGQDWTSLSTKLPRTSLARWISDSDDFDRAVVNTTWHLVFGRPLIPLVSNVDVVGLEHRRQLLDFLAQQFNSADHDLSQLVSWMVASRTFATQRSEITREQWQGFDDRQLETRQMADLAFANGVLTIADAPLRKRLQDNLNYVVTWRSNSKPKSMLAQPAQLDTAQKSLPPKTAEAVLFSSGFAVHGLRHTVAEQAYVDRIIKAEKLTWVERVQHVVGLSSMGLANDDIQFSAKELLQQHSGNAKSALLDLMWAVRALQL